MIDVLMPPAAVAAAQAPRRRIGPRPQRSYSCPHTQIRSRIEIWYFRNSTSADVVWAMGVGGRLVKRPAEIALREKMVQDLCIDAPAAERLSPGDILRHAQLATSIGFTIAKRLRSRAA